MPLISELEQQGAFLFRHRSNLPVILLVSGLAVCSYSIYYGTFNVHSQPLYEVVSLIMGLLGLGIRIVTVGHTPANTSGRNTAEGQLADQLNTTGMYSLVRHPLYVGNFLMWLSIAFLIQHIWFALLFVTCYWLYYERIMMAEESFLIKKFGQQYIDWSVSVPAFIPKLANWTKPKYSFSLKKVLKKEKNGLFALFLLFALFKGTQDFLLKGSIDHTQWQFYAMYITGALYLLFKVLKKQGKLDEEGR